MRGTDARWYGVPTPSHPRPQAVSFARCVEPRCATRSKKRKFSQWKLDGRGHRGAKVAADSRTDLCQERDNRMTHTPNNEPAPAAGQRRLPPVRVKIYRADGKLARVHPPDGQGKNWWQRLSKALGTTSSDFVNASLFQIQSASRSPWGGISELAMNAALAMIEAAAPKDEIEAALAVQMACTHTAAMAVLAKANLAFATEQRIAAFGSPAARLMRAYATQVEVLRRLRNGGQQFVRVEHVHVKRRWAGRDRQCKKIRNLAPDLRNSLALRSAHLALGRIERHRSAPCYCGLNHDVMPS